MADLHELALAMPETVCEVTDGRPGYSVRGKVVCWHREPRKDAVDAASGERLTDVVVFRVPDLEVKDALVADDRGIFFTTPHWNGFPAVLMRKRDLKRVPKRELADLVAEAWLTKAQKRVAKAWLAENSGD